MNSSFLDQIDRGKSERRGENLSHPRHNVFRETHTFSLGGPSLHKGNYSGTSDCGQVDLPEEERPQDESSCTD